MFENISFPLHKRHVTLVAMKTIIMGSSVQGLIAASLLGRAGMPVDVVEFPNDDYTEFHEGFKTGPVTHIPFALSYDVVDTLDLESHGLDVTQLKSENPFQKLPFYDGLKTLLAAFQSLDEMKPAYKEKAWRDAWGTFELGRVLSESDAKTQELFAQSTTLSLKDLMDATDLDDKDKAQIMALCLCGSKTDPSAKGSAASILPAMIPFEAEAYIIQGSLHTLFKILKQAAMSNGVTFHEGQVIQSIEVTNNNIDTVTLNGGETLTADYYVLDHDPVVVFKDFMGEGSLPPAFRNRVMPTQNLRECARIQLALSSLPDGITAYKMIAPTTDYIYQARSDFKKDGGSQLALLSIANVTQDNLDFAPEGHYALDILAHYFDPKLSENDDTREVQVLAVIQALDYAFPGIADHIVHSTSCAMNSQGGQANFMGAMPLLQLFKIFFGHHAMGYDVPHHNLLVAGYGAGACAHYHVNNGGMRVATLLQSLKNDGKT
jgi:phytoene dehydrogenase-like protein